MKIKILTEDVYSRIAAGEIIDRPASVVRELVDNAIDAGADEITIRLENGGIDSISVADNGSGIDKEDMPVALLKHSTSKIETIDDLFNIDTLGFRGEALHSIKTVSKLTVTSSTDPTGLTPANRMSYHNEFALEPVQGLKGTRIDVEELFYNLPARRKFLKSQTVELNGIKTVVGEKLFTSMNVKFNLYNDSKLLFSTAGDGDFRGIFFEFNRNENKFEINKRVSEFDGIKITSYYSDYSVFFTSRKYQSLYVNNRPVSAPFFYSALSTGYKDYVSPGRHPLFYVFLEIAPSLIDVNIHPAKREVKFFDQNKVFEAVRRAVVGAYSERVVFETSGTPFTPQRDYQIDKAGTDGGGVNERVELYSRDLPWNETPRGNSVPAAGDNYFDAYMRAVRGAENDDADYKILGVVFKTYILLERDDKLMLLDFHALTEGYIYKKTKSAFLQNQGSVNLLIPAVVDLEQITESVEKRIAELNGAGFDIETVDGGSIVVRAVPEVLFSSKDIVVIIETIRDYLSGSERNEDIVESILITYSCREAYKSGDNLNPVEIKELTNIFFRDGVTRCPHGRPVSAELSRDSIEKLFQRKM